MNGEQYTAMDFVNQFAFGKSEMIVDKQGEVLIFHTVDRMGNIVDIGNSI